MSMTWFPQLEGFQSSREAFQKVEKLKLEREIYVQEGEQGQGVLASQPATGDTKHCQQDRRVQPGGDEFRIRV